MSKIRKALLAGAGAFIASLAGAAVKAGGVPGATDLITALAAGLVVAYGVWRVPNATA